MSVTYGTEEGRLSVGIDVSMSPSSVGPTTSSVTITWTVYAKATYAFNDPQVLTLSNALSTSKNYTMVAANYTTTVYKIGSWSQTVNTSYSGTVSKTLVAGISNVFNGATPGHSRTITIPKRPPDDPDPATSATATLSGTTVGQIRWTRPSSASTAAEIWENVVVQRSVNGGSYVTRTTQVGTDTSYDDTGLLANTTYQWRVYATNDTGASAYTYTGTLQTSLPIPTSVTPAAGATVTKPNPTLGGSFTAISGGTGKLEWEIASDSIFETNVWNVVESDIDLKASGATTENPTVAQLALPNGTWYIRARVINNTGMAGPWSTGTSFTVNTPALAVPTAITPAAGAAVTTMQPTLGATLGVDSAGRSVKAEWQIATDSGFTTNLRTIIEPDSDLRASGATTEVVPIEDRLRYDHGATYYIRARTVGSDGATSAWSASTSFTFSITAPPTPTLITPATAGPTVTTNTPTLGATLGAPTENRTVKAEWQLATDAGFTSNLRTVTESDGDLRSSGATTEVVPVGSKLYQATWYIRAREIDQYGQAGSWSAGTTFVVSHQPSAILTSPANNTIAPYDVSANTFTWTFTDPSSTDTQSAYQLIVERNDTGANVLDTGKVTSNVSSGTHLISSSVKDIQLRWKVRVWDNDNVAGSYSSYSLVTLSEVPTVTITNPANGSEVTTGQPTITWTNDASTVQATRRVVITRTSDSVVVADSGIGTTTSLSWTTPTVILQNGEAYSVTVTVVDTSGMEGADTNAFTVAYQAPDAVIINVDESRFDEEGFVDLDWSGTTPDGSFLQWKVYRRLVLENEWTVIFTSNDPNVRYYEDWMIPGSDVYEYAVTQTAERFGIFIESPIVFTESRTVESTHYWLLNPYDSTDNLRVSNVTDDSYSDDYDEAELIIIGRGRKMNHGTRYGYTGSLVAQFRDDVYSTARAKRIKLQALKAARTTYYMRNPFGDMLEVSLGNISISRIAGVGNAEFVDVTIPYREVF